MHLLGRLIMGLLALALGVFAVKEIAGATNMKVGIIAVMILFMAIAGLAEALRTHPRR
jgi:hypothetical protein